MVTGTELSPLSEHTMKIVFLVWETLYPPDSEMFGLMRDLRLCTKIYKKNGPDVWDIAPLSK